MPFSDDVLNKKFAQILSLKDRDYLQIEICILLKELLTPSKFDEYVCIVSFENMHLILKWKTCK